MREQTLFIEALERHDPAERAAFLNQACGSNDPLRRRIERLLERHQQADSLLDPADRSIVATVDMPAETESPGTTIGNLGMLDQAEPLLAQAQALGAQALGPDEYVTLQAQHVLALVVQKQGNLARAGALLRRVKASWERSFGALHPGALHTLKDLAYLVRQQGVGDEARRLQLEAVNRNETGVRRGSAASR
jgi:hypothetical protein